MLVTVETLRAKSSDLNGLGASARNFSVASSSEHGLTISITRKPCNSSRAGAEDCEFSEIGSIRDGNRQTVAKQ